MKISMIIASSPSIETVSDAIRFTIQILEATSQTFTPETPRTNLNQNYLERSQLIMLDLLNQHELGTLDL